MQLNINLPKMPKRRGKFSRDIFLIIVGAAGLLNEAFIEDGERPTLIIAFLACMGFPVFLRTDEAQTEKTEAAREKEANISAEDAS